MSESQFDAALRSTTKAAWGLVLLIAVWLNPGNNSFASENSVQQFGERHALVIGIDRYNHQLPLEHAVDDARRLKSVLEAQGYTVTSLLNFDADPLYTLQTLNAIGTQMDAGEGREHGTLIFAYSGHGFQQDDENYLAMGNARVSDLRSSALSLKRIRRVMQQSGIGKQVLFIDACRTDPSRSANAERRSFTFDDTSKGMAILYSTGPGELSYEDSKKGQGVFSYHLANGLEGAAADTKGNVTFDALYGYVKQKVRKDVYARFNKVQIPYIAGERSGDIILSHTAQTPLATNGSPVGAQVPEEKLPLRDGQILESDRKKRWSLLAKVAGVLAVGALLASARSDDNDDESEPSVTLVVPTP